MWGFAVIASISGGVSAFMSTGRLLTEEGLCSMAASRMVRFRRMLSCAKASAWEAGWHTASMAISTSPLRSYAPTLLAPNLNAATLLAPHAPTPAFLARHCPAPPSSSKGRHTQPSGVAMQYIGLHSDTFNGQRTFGGAPSKASEN